MSAPRGPKHAKTMAPTKYLYLVYSGLFIAIFLLDLAIPRGVAVAVLYILPVFISFWDANGKSVYVWTLLAIALIVTGYFLSSPGASTWQSIANRSLSILVVCSSAFLVIKRREVEESRKCSKFCVKVDGFPILHPLERKQTPGPRMGLSNELVGGAGVCWSG